MRTAEEFWACVAQDEVDACWEWRRGRLRRGYGWLLWRGRNQVASRVAWELANGSVPPGSWVLHRCDNPPCCNPAHLFLGDRQANVDDMMAKGRHGTMRGEAQARAKLTDDMVREIRTAHASGESLRSLTRRFPVSRPVIRGVARGEAWRHVP